MKTVVSSSDSKEQDAFLQQRTEEENSQPIEKKTESDPDSSNLSSSSRNREHDGDLQQGKEEQTSNDLDHNRKRPRSPLTQHENDGDEESFTPPGSKRHRP